MRMVDRELLRALMTRHELSHRNLATQVGCTYGFVSHLVSGRSTTCTEPLATRIAETLGVRLETLFEDPA